MDEVVGPDPNAQDQRQHPGGEEITKTGLVHAGIVAGMAHRTEGECDDRIVLHFAFESRFKTHCLN